MGRNLDRAISTPFAEALAFNNLVINGGMEVSQELGGTGRTLSGAGFVGGYVLDCFMCFSGSASGTRVITAAQAVPPGSPSFGAAFPSCMKMTATTGQATLPTTDQYFFATYLEGYRTAKLGWGNAVGGQTLMVGFWVYATVAGTMTLSVSNGPNTRFFIREIVINSAATWEYKTVTIPACPDGVWNVTNTLGVALNFGLGGGPSVQATPNTWTSAALVVNTAATTNFFATTGNVVAITGLFAIPGTELPTAARSPFAIRPYDQEFLLSQRHWQFLSNVVVDTPTAFQSWTIYPMRAAPTVTGGGAGFSVSSNQPTTISVNQTARAFQNITLNARL